MGSTPISAPRFPPSARTRCSAACRSARALAAVAFASSASRCEETRASESWVSRFSLAEAASACARVASTADCACPRSALSISASVSPAFTRSPGNLRMRRTRPEMRAPTAATRSGSNVTVPVTLTTGVSDAGSAGANSSFARCA